MILTGHVTGDRVELVAAAGRGFAVFFFPLGFSDVLDEAVEAFVHPGPLTFVGIDDHGKVVVSDFVNDYADEACFGSPRIG